MDARFATDVLACPAAGCAVVTISFHGIPDTLEEWEEYRAAYLRTYAAHARFVLVFDTRQVAMPSLATVQRKVALLQKLKHRTVGQAAAVVVLTDFPLVRALVHTLARAGGQAAPFYICTDLEEAAEQVADTLQTCAGQVTPGAVKGAATLGTVGPAAVAALVLLRFLLFARHFLRCFLGKQRPVAWGQPHHPHAS